MESRGESWIGRGRAMAMAGMLVGCTVTAPENSRRGDDDDVGIAAEELGGSTP